MIERAKVKQAIAYYVLNLLLAGIGILMPLLEGLLVNNFLYQKNELRFYYLVLLIVISLLVQFFIEYFLDRYKFIKKEKLVLIEMNQVVRSLFGKNTEKVLTYNPNYFHNRILEDISQIWNFYFETLGGILVNVISFIVVMIILLNTNQLIFLITLFFIPLYMTVYVKFFHKLTRVEYAVSESANTVYASRENIFQRYLEIKAKQNIENEVKSVEKKGYHLIQHIFRSFRIHYHIYGVKLFISSILKITVFILLGKVVMEEHLTIGVFIYTLQYMNALLSSVDSLLQFMMDIPKFKVSHSRMNEVSDLNSDQESEGNIAKIHQICLEKFNFSYSRSTPLYADPVTQTFTSGEHYVITGKNGIGKTTLFLAMLGLYSKENYSGKIILNNTEISQLNRQRLRQQHYSIMLQHAPFNGKKVTEYLEENQLSDLTEIMKNESLSELFFSESFNVLEKLEEDFENLSGGEKQLLNLLVCVVKDADVYLLDEPFASLHGDVKVKARRLLEQISKKDKIVISITHDEILASEKTLEIR